MNCKGNIRMSLFPVSTTFLHNVTAGKDFIRTQPSKKWVESLGMEWGAITRRLVDDRDLRVLARLTPAVARCVSQELRQALSIIPWSFEELPNEL